MELAALIILVIAVVIVCLWRRKPEQVQTNTDKEQLVVPDAYSDYTRQTADREPPA